MVTSTRPGFDYNTRAKYVPIGSATRSSGGQSRIDIPQTGVLSRLYCTVRGTVNALSSGPNAFGQSAIINKIRLLTGSSIDLVNISGPGYFHLLKPFLDAPGNQIPYTTGVTALAAGVAPKLDFVVPVQMNLRDQIGYFMMQNRQTLATLVVDWETDANLGTGLTWTTQPVLTVYMELMTVPQNPENFPRLATVHTINEDQTTVSAAGQVTYSWPLNNSYLQMIHGCGFAASGADSFSRYQLRANQSDYLYDVAPEFFDIYMGYQRMLTRALGVIPIDLIGQTGLGNYDLPRDTINSAALTDLDSIITATGATTLYSVRREIVPIAQAPSTRS